MKGKTGPLLEREWGVTKSVVEAASAEAWRRVQAEVLDRPEIQVFAVTTLRNIVRAQLREAKGAKQPGMERRVAVDAAKALLAYSEGSGLPKEWGELTEAEKWARVDEAQARIDAIRATLPPRAKELSE